MSAGRLVHKDTGKEVLIGATLKGRNGDVTLIGFRKPHKPSSSGRVFVEAVDDTFEQSLFPHVFDLEIVDYD